MTDDTKRQANGGPDRWGGPVPVTRAVLEKTDFLAQLEEEDAWRREQEARARAFERKRQDSGSDP